MYTTDYDDYTPGAKYCHHGAGANCGAAPLQVASFAGVVLLPTGLGGGTVVQPMPVGLMSHNLILATDNCSFALPDLCVVIIPLTALATQPLVIRLKVLGKT